MEPVTRSSSIGLKLGLGEILVGIGAAAVAASIVLRWVDIGIIKATARGVPVQVLWDYTTHSNDPSLLVVLIPAVLLCVAGIVLLRARYLALVGGILAGAVGAMYIFQTHQVLRATRASHPGVGLSDFLGIAPYICIAGGVLAVIGGLYLSRRPSS